MKKRAIVNVLCFAVIAALLLSGCGGSGSDNNTNEASANITVVDNRPTVENDTPSTQHVTVTDEDFEITKYLHEDSFSTQCFLVVTNNSEATVSLSVNGIARDSAGGMIGADDLSFDVLGPGETSMNYFYFSDVKGVSSVDYTLSYETNPHYAPVISNLSMEQTLNNRNVVVNVTNEGDTCAEFVEAHAIFFDASNNVISHSSSYLTDGNNEIKPGKSIAAQLDSYEGYDHVEVYLTGRSTGKTVNSETSLVSDDQFEITEYLYENPYSTTCFLVVKNNASMPVAIKANSIARDSSGTAVGADSMEIDIIGPGETSIGYFFFSDVKGVASVEYEFGYNTDPYYTPVIGSLSVEQTVNANNVIVAVTNNGTVPAQFVEAYALFFDAQNNVVGSANGYVIDDENEIKPGKMLVEQLDVYGSFDHCEVYLTGRG